MSITVSNGINNNSLLQLNDNVAISINEPQLNCSSNSVALTSTDHSSFQLNSGVTLTDDSESVYFVLEPDQKVYSNRNGLADYHSISAHVTLETDDTQQRYNCSEDVHCVSKIIPGRTRAGVTKCLELGCNFICSRIPQLRTHLEEAHGIPQERKLFAFNSEKDFKTWLSAVEREARCTFMRRRGWQSNKNGSTTACFYCHRGGAYTSRATKKQVKSQGSCKIGIECTASMKVTIWTVPNTAESNQGLPFKHVQVEAYLQHYGHNLDLSHTRLTKVEKDDIARKLSSGISRNKILDDIRGTLDASSAPHRLHLLSLQDLYNIEKKEGIQSKKKHNQEEEGTTVQAWIEKMQKSEENPVLLIKYQQEKAKEICSCLSDDDFILILQTPLQAMMLRKYGPHQSICIDITRGEAATNGAKSDPCFYLLAIEVIIPIFQEKEEVFPVAWFVCNRKDEAVIRIFLNEIKKNLSDLILNPSFLLLPGSSVTGGCDWFGLWTSIFGAGPRKLISSWHILSDWKQRISRANIKSSSQEEARLITNLQTVLHSTSVDEFVHLLEEFLTDLLRESRTLPFANFFKSYYSSQPEVWSRAYRTEVQIQTESKFEEYHSKTARHIYHEGFKRKQLDVLIKTLMRYSRDRALNKLRQTFKLTNDMSIRSATSSNHAASCKLPINFVTPHKNSRSWSVMSVIDSVRAVERSPEKGKPILLKKVAVEYIVTCADTDICPARLMCAYRCTECGVCAHHMSCTCQSDQKNLLPADGLPVLCEHCHLVVRFVLENDQKVEDLFTASNSTVEPTEKAKTPDSIDQLSIADPNQVVVMVVNDEVQGIASAGNEEKDLLNKTIEQIQTPEVQNEVTLLLSSSDCEIDDEHSIQVKENTKDSVKQLSHKHKTKRLPEPNPDISKDASSNPSARRSSRKRNTNYNCKEFPSSISSSTLKRKKKI